MTATRQLQRMFGRFDVTPRPMQEWAYNASKKGRNLIIVAPTGSGKTEAAYLASKNWGRTTYALPMKTLANDIHERLSLYEQRISGQEWTIQHSSVKGDKRLAHDFSVSTIDQVLTGYFGFGREAFIRGKNVLRNHLILDEVQLFDPKRALLSLMSLLEHTTSAPFNNHFCMMTATFPTALHEYLKDRFDADIYIERKRPVEKDVTLAWTESLPVEGIINKQSKQIFTCNTQNQQVNVVKSLIKEGIDPERLIVLNSRLYPEDRDLIERLVRHYFGKESKENNKVLIATQIIEAGMDISADTFYTYEAPIDSLIQREGRCARWGGEGVYTVIKQELIKGNHPVYANDLVETTSDLIRTHVGQSFTWDMQLAWTDTVLNPLYEAILTNKRKRKEFEHQLEYGSSNELIRAIQSINVIPVLNPTAVTESDFARTPIGLPLYNVKKNEAVRLNTADNKPLVSGDTVIVDATHWTYDVCGLRRGEGTETAPFPIGFEDEALPYEDYIEETLEEHLIETGTQMVNIITEEAVMAQKTTEYDARRIGAGHDIGKATSPWQRMIRWNGDGTWADEDVLYGHRPWIPRSNRGIIGLTHSVIGVVLLKDQLSTLEQNVILSHHGRVIADEEPCVNGVDWERGMQDVLRTVGFSPEPLRTNSHRLSRNDLITPGDKDWAQLVYLAGALMQADRQAIQTVKVRKTVKRAPAIDKTTTL